jgi:hypothetical protein
LASLASRRAGSGTSSGGTRGGFVSAILTLALFAFSLKRESDGGVAANAIKSTFTTSHLRNVLSFLDYLASFGKFALSPQPRNGFVFAFLPFRSWWLRLCKMPVQHHPNTIGGFVSAESITKNPLCMGIRWVRLCKIAFREIILPK